MSINAKITKVGNHIAEDEKKPANPIIDVTSAGKKGLFNIKIKHPNKNWFLPEFTQVLKDLELWKNELVIKKIIRERSIERVEEIPASIKRKYNKEHKFLKSEFTHDVLYDKNHKAKDFDDAILLAREILSKKFSNVETTFEQIKHIPYYKKGRVTLNLKKK